MSEKKIYDFTVYEWHESQFLENVQIILSVASILGIHRIERNIGEAVYLVPEAYYLECKRQMVVKSTDSDED